MHGVKFLFSKLCRLKNLASLNEVVYGPMYTLTFCLGLEHVPSWIRITLLCALHKLYSRNMHTTTLHNMHTLKFNSSSLEIQLVPPIYRITFTSTFNAIRYHTHITAVKIEVVPTGFLVNHTKNVVAIHNKKL